VTVTSLEHVDVIYYGQYTWHKKIVHEADGIINFLKTTFLQKVGYLCVNARYPRSFIVRDSLRLTKDHRRVSEMQLVEDMAIDYTLDITSPHQVVQHY